MNNRRKLVLALGAGALVPTFASYAQQPVRRVGFLTPAAQPNFREEVFREGLRKLGWIEGRNLSIEYRRAANNTERLGEMAAEMVSMKLDLIVASTTPAVAAAKKATSVIPVVSISADPVGNGFAASLSRPGGNITGLSLVMPELVGKHLQMLREINPRLSRVAYLAYAPDPSHRIFLKEAEKYSGRIKVQLHSAIISSADELESAFEGMRAARVEALMVQPLFTSGLGLASRVAELAAKFRLLAICSGDGFAEAGGLIYFGPDPRASFERMAIYADRILKGAKPADLPIEQPQKFEVILNQKSAKALGVKIPPSILVRADKLIE
jgi:putative ABC transport system substrate-binding protein